MNYFVRITAILILMIIPQLSVAEIVFKEVLDKVYGGYDKKQDCWITENDGDSYCMKIDRSDKIVMNKQQRVYLLVAGDSSTEVGHAATGLIGAFILEEQNGQTQIVASSAKIPVGIDGQAPKKWQFVKLGASYWGWQNTIDTYHQGYLTSMYSILAPHNNQVLELANFIIFSSNDISVEGENATATNKEPCIDENNQPCSSISADVKIDAHESKQQVYPLRVTVKGKDKGKKLKPKTWTFLFDTQKWRYIEPKQWSLKF